MWLRRSQPARPDEPVADPSRQYSIAPSKDIMAYSAAHQARAGISGAGRIFLPHALNHKIGDHFCGHHQSLCYRANNLRRQMRRKNEPALNCGGDATCRSGRTRLVSPARLSSASRRQMSACPVSPGGYLKRGLPTILRHGALQAFSFLELCRMMHSQRRASTRHAFIRLCQIRKGVPRSRPNPASSRRINLQLPNPAVSLGPRLTEARRVRRDVPTAPGLKARCINRALEQDQHAGSGSDWIKVGGHSIRT
jgi:hypothetical protein